jgi:DNA (cytosine-5)-methyltransferase 1
VDRKPRLADLFCCAGGAARGYQRAGFHVTGFDIADQPRYIGDAFERRDVLSLTAEELRERFDVIHASPPCQWFSRTHGMAPKGRTGGGNGGYKKPRERAARDDHPNLLPQTRALLRKSGRPYIMENVQDAHRAMVDPILLCGTMFGLRVYRHRLFEANWLIIPPAHPAHTHGVTSGAGNSQGRGRGYSASTHGAQMITVAGNNFNRREGMAAMGVDWEANQKEVAQMIPPAYTEFLGRQLLARLEQREAA